MFKTCSRCHQEKPKTSEFFGLLKGSFRAACKICRKIESSETYTKNKEKLKERMKSPEKRAKANESQKNIG